MQIVNLYEIDITDKEVNILKENAPGKYKEIMKAWDSMNAKRIAAIAANNGEAARDANRKLRMLEGYLVAHAEIAAKRIKTA